MESGIDPKIDYVFKRLCGDEDQALVTVDLLNAVLQFPPLRVIRGLLFLNPFVAKDYLEGQTPILDIKVRDDPGRHYLMEMQQLVRFGFAKRVLYYWAGGHGEQLLKGERYETLQPTYHISWLNAPLFADDRFHHRFRVRDEQGLEFCGDLEIHTLELTKFQVPVTELQTPLERWCYFFKHGASLDPTNLPATLNVPVIRQAVEVLMKISLDEIERERAAERQRALQDALSDAADLRDARQVGLQEGLEKGLEKGELLGLEKGEIIGRIRLLEQWLGISPRSRSELQQLTEAQLRQQEDDLQRQLTQKNALAKKPKGKRKRSE